jgi:hypothetical protein
MYKTDSGSDVSVWDLNALNLMDAIANAPPSEALSVDYLVAFRTKLASTLTLVNTLFPKSQKMYRLLHDVKVDKGDWCVFLSLIIDQTVALSCLFCVTGSWRILPKAHNTSPAYLMRTIKANNQIASYAHSFQAIISRYSTSSPSSVDTLLIVSSLVIAIAVGNIEEGELNLLRLTDQFKMLYTLEV